MSRGQSPQDLFLQVSLDAFRLEGQIESFDKIVVRLKCWPTDSVVLIGRACEIDPRS